MQSCSVFINWFVYFFNPSLEHYRLYIFCSLKISFKKNFSYFWYLPMSPRWTRQCWHIYEQELDCGFTMALVCVCLLLIIPNWEDFTRQGKSTLNTVHSSCSSWNEKLSIISKSQILYWSLFKHFSLLFSITITLSWIIQDLIEQ